jgi:hypothetical protein
VRREDSFIGIASSAGNRADGVGFAFKFLNQVRAETFAPMAFRDLM